MRAFLTVLVVCILSMSLVCCGWRATESVPPAETETASKASIIPATEECSRLATFDNSEVAGWKLSSPINTYDSKSLFDYINGAAELYFVYDFRAVAAAEYQNGETSIIIDVYDMTAPEGSFGIYSLNRYPEANYVGIGNEGILMGTTLDFWKGRYFCKVYSFDMSEKYQKDVINFGGRLASKIEEAGEEPSVVRKLPQNGLIPGTAMFFSRKLGLDNIHYVAEENILKLGAETRGAVAEYEIDNVRFQFFNIEYASPDRAILAFRAYSNYLERKGKLVSAETTAIGTRKMFKMDNRFTSVSYRIQRLSGFWDIESREAAETVSQEIK